jgi:hypothetical protein
MNTSYEKLSFYNNYFGGYIDDENIVSADFYGNKQIVGVTMKKYNETMDLLNSYYNKLVELGVIEKEKTPEDIAKEQQELMQSMMKQLQTMQEKIDCIQTNNIKDDDNGRCKQDSECSSELKTAESITEKQTERSNLKSKKSDEYNKQSNRSSKSS